MRKAPAFLAAVSCGSPSDSAPCPVEGKCLPTEGTGGGSPEEPKKFPKVPPEIYDAPQSRGPRIQSAAWAEGLGNPGR